MTDSYFSRLIHSFVVPSMAVRCTKQEIMDDPACDTRALLKTLNHFTLINTLFSRSLYLVRRYFFDRCAVIPGRSVTVLDVGAGGGDFARSLNRWASGRGIPVQITCLDYDARIAAYAREHCASIDNIEVVAGDIRSEAFTHRRFDLVFANHFLHHIDSDKIPRTIALLNSMAERGFLINDLHRKPATYFGYSLFAAFFLPGSFAWYDGGLSIRRGFIRKELQEYITAAGLTGTLRVTDVFPGRLVIYRK